jgi:hypothetical protein
MEIAKTNPSKPQSPDLSEQLPLNYHSNNMLENTSQKPSKHPKEDNDEDIMDHGDQK